MISCLVTYYLTFKWNSFGQFEYVLRDLRSHFVIERILNATVCNVWKFWYHISYMEISRPNFVVSGVNCECSGTGTYGCARQEVEKNFFLILIVQVWTKHCWTKLFYINLCAKRILTWICMWAKCDSVCFTYIYIYIYIYIYTYIYIYITMHVCL